MAIKPSCPGCDEIGVHDKEDQYCCSNPNCRVVVFHDYGQINL